MRFVLGIIVGILLTVGFAYVHDAATPGAPTEVAAVAAADADGRMVNWDVVNRDLRGVNGWVRSQWAWLSGKLNKAG